MIVSFRYGFLFVKGIKVAGTSVEAFLSDTLGDDAIVSRGSTYDLHRPRNYIADNGRGEFWNHMGAADAKAVLGDEAFSSLRRLAIIRSPFEKVRSFYYMKRGRGLEYDTDQAIEDCSSEAIRLLDSDGTLLTTDLVCFEQLDEGLDAFFRSIGLAFPGQLEHRQKGWQRAKFVNEAIFFSEEQVSLIYEKFAFEFGTYLRLGWRLPSPNVAHVAG